MEFKGQEVSRVTVISRVPLDLQGPQAPTWGPLGFHGEQGSQGQLSPETTLRLPNVCTVFALQAQLCFHGNSSGTRGYFFLGGGGGVADLKRPWTRWSVLQADFVNSITCDAKDLTCDSQMCPRGRNSVTTLV